MELVILIGLQGAGKSTFRQSRFDATHVVVSKDHFRNNRRPAQRQELLLREALSLGKSVVVDNTNVRLEDRQALIGLAREFAALPSGYFVRSTLDESLARNALREGKARVPDKAVAFTAKAFVLPSWSEGYVELYDVVPQPDRTFLVTASPAP